MNLADQMLSREQMKGVKGGEWYCDCGGGPVTKVGDLDCVYVCSGITPSSSWGTPSPSQYNNPYDPGTPSTISTSLYQGGKCVVGCK